MCAHREDYDAFETLPAWALRTLAAHARNRRPVRYAAGQLPRAETRDPSGTW
ncbi:MAG TPA: hypothetical protein VFC42_12600 [Methylomirabilota bacterium]|jgi:deoxyribodipyrimidine photo-lyase|nr:hypothetical protein [Methylomirabilota bacterium]